MITRAPTPRPVVCKPRRWPPPHRRCDRHRGGDSRSTLCSTSIEHMERSVKGLLGGGLKPNDPRRFLIEAMIGAMNADGVVDPRETQAVERQIASHPLFH